MNDLVTHEERGSQSIHLIKQQCDMRCFMLHYFKQYLPVHSNLFEGDPYPQLIIKSQESPSKGRQALEFR